jgi:sulfite reductase alpha subunit-like flavoprotein
MEQKVIILPAHMWQSLVSRSINFIENSLYFGCRSVHQDQHYGTEWEERVHTGTLRYRLSCSRDGEEGTAKVYVQHLIEQDAKFVWEILNNRRGCMYISGYVVVYLFRWGAECIDQKNWI